MGRNTLVPTVVAQLVGGASVVGGRFCVQANVIEIGLSATNNWGGTVR